MNEKDSMTGDFERYLKVLGIRRKKPGYGELVQIVRNHVMRVPFETISKLYYLRTIGLKEIPPLNLFLDGIPRHGYLMKPAPRHVEEFEHAVSSSFRPDATFMNCLLLVRFGAVYSRSIQNMMLIEAKGKKVTRKSLHTMEELVDAIEQIFSIPPAVSQVALEGLPMNRDPWPVIGGP
ncbi:MAG: hypothetical protein ABIJ04_06690 [Bacteroidota bacterium]